MASPHNHKILLAQCRLLARQLGKILDNKTEAGSLKDRQLPDRQSVLLLICLAALAKRGLKPACATHAQAQLIAALAPVSQLAEDRSSFATNLVGNLFNSWNFSLNCSPAALKDVLQQGWVSELLSNPLLPGWMWQVLAARPRARIGIPPPGDEGNRKSSASARAKDISGTQVADLTQWFTPAWIAEFLIDETVGWLLKRERAGTPDLRFIDPACGAGHLLVQSLREIIANSQIPPAVALSHALEQQIFGCDVEQQVLDLCGFSLYLFCRDIDRHTDFPLPHIYRIRESGEPDNMVGSLWLGLSGHAETSGYRQGNQPANLQACGPRGSMPLLESPLLGQYTAIATNPPFLGHRLIPPELTSFLDRYYSSGRFDLYAAFLSLCSRLMADGGRMGLICQQSFMSVARFKQLRTELLQSCHLRALVQLGSGAFGPVSGEKINSAIVVAEKMGTTVEQSPAESTIECWRLLGADRQKQAELQGIRSQAVTTVQQSCFATINGAPLSFWCPPELSRLFQRLPGLGSECTGIVCVNGLFTCNNKLFVRNYREIDPSQVDQWVPYDKGGGHKWYKTTPLMLHWADNGNAIRQYRGKQGQSISLPGEQYYFQTGITYSYIGTRGFRARLLSPNSVFDIASSAVFTNKVDLFYLLGFFNSALVRFLLGVLNPTINFQIGDLRRLPFAFPDQETVKKVSGAASTATGLARYLDTFDHQSPAYRGPAFSRFAGQATKSQDARSAYDAYLSDLHRINETERHCQSTIDDYIFELYQISTAHRRLILADPSVSSTDAALATALSFQQFACPGGSTVTLA